jgi:hypothetical protein
MKVGDKVRFLSEIGGGVVAGFQGKDIVLVEDEDGFQIPTQIKDCIVVESDNYDSGKVHTDAMPEVLKKSIVRIEKKKKTDDDPSEKEVTFVPPAEERRGGDVLSAYLTFVPVDIKEISQTKFEAYFVNDSNYYMYYTYLTADGNNWRVRSQGEVDPNTKEFIEEFDRDILNEIEHLGIQIIAYKKKKTFMRKSPVDISFRVDTTKFYKLHTFQENDFFEVPALVYTLVENDVPMKQLTVDAKQLEREMMQKKHIDDCHASQPARKVNKDDNLIVIDLHANELLETTNGMSAADILNYQLDIFRRTIDENKNKKGQKIVFIHGKGEGVLRGSIINELRYKYKQYSYQDASFQEYGYGATQITIK